jgi:hypothetical protein
MSCCEKTESTQVFLEQKLKNFRAFVEPHCSTELQKDMLAQYDSLEAVMPLLIKAIAAKNIGQSDALLDQFCAGFSLERQELQAFRAKAKRYLDMFVDVLTT